MSFPGIPAAQGIALNVATNLGGAIGTVLGTAVGAIGQSFATVPLTNTQLAYYTLVIRSPTPPLPAVVTYTFPLSPSNIKRKLNAMTNIYDVGAPVQTAPNGVQRVADLYGLAPTIFSIEGTTGWQYHATDGYAFTGMQSVAALLDALEQFANLNKFQEQTGNAGNPYVMEFYDYFFQDYWQVVPIGEQSFTQDAQKPLLFNYSLQLAGTYNIQGPVSVPDGLGAAISSLSAGQAAQALEASFSTALTSYSNTVLGGSATALTI